ncbi:MAG: hypothetical protein KF723_22955 [Rhizobiaceae bacterium]|nr:hypothetical protein [Rhizobiaceae bacterium]
MKALLEKYLPVRAPEDGGGGQGGGAGGEGGGSGGQAGGAGGGDGGQGGSGAAAAAAYRPDGLADNLFGKSDKETIDLLHGAVKGYRDRDAAKDMPDKPEGYLSFEGVDAKAFTLDQQFQPHFDLLAKDAGALAAAAVAKEHGVPRPVFLNAMQAMLGAAKEAGVLEPVVDAKAERAALLPETHKNAPEAEQSKAIDARMTANEDFIKLMVQNGGLDKADAEYLQLMTFDSAKGHRFMEWVRSKVQAGGAGPGAHGAGGGGGDTAESLRAEMALPKHTSGHPDFDPKSYAAFNERYKKFHGAGTA